MTFNAAIRLLCLFLFSSPLLKCVVAQDVGEFDFTPMMRGFDDMGDMQDHRRMASWGSWSWANLLFEVGLCSSEGCECGTPHGPLCGCPHCNCNHHHHPPFCHDICTYGCNSTSSGNVNGNGQNSDYENVADDQRDVGQQGSSRRNWIYALVAAAVATAGVGAFAIRKRRQRATARSLGEGGKTDEADDYALMGGMTAAFGGIMSRMGLNSGDSTSGSSTASEETGVVSKRMNLLKNGDDVVPLDGGAAPQFIEVPKGNHVQEPLPVDEGIEVEGPYRPSSQYAI